MEAGNLCISTTPESRPRPISERLRGARKLDTISGVRCSGPGPPFRASWAGAVVGKLGQDAGHLFAVEELGLAELEGLAVLGGEVLHLERKRQRLGQRLAERDEAVVGEQAGAPILRAPRARSGELRGAEGRIVGAADRISPPATATM